MHWAIQNELPMQQGGSTGWERRCESQGQEDGEAPQGSAPGHGTTAAWELHKAQR